MLWAMWSLTRGYRLRPWRSPYLRWRIETYAGVHAEQIGFREFWSFAWQQRHQLLRYLRWAARLRKRQSRRDVVITSGNAFHGR